MHVIWNDIERAFVEKNAGLITDAEGAKQLSALVGRTITVHSWRKQRQILGIRKSPGRGVCRVVQKTLAGENQSVGKVADPGEAIPIVTSSSDKDCEAYDF